MGQGADRDEVGAGGRVARPPSRGSPARRPRPGCGRRRAATAAATSAGLHVVEQHQVGAGLHGHLDLVEGVALHLARSGRASGRLAPATAASMDDAGQVVVLDAGCPSDSEPRWLTPPPARTAAFSRARSPGVVLRVSRIRAVAPAASTKRRVRVATPERWPSRLRAVRSAVSTDASGPSTPGQDLAGVDAVAVGGRPPHHDGGIDGGEGLGRGQPAGQHPGARATSGGGHHGAVGGTRPAVRSPNTPEVLGQGPGHDVANRRHRRVEPGRRHCTNLCEKASDVAGKSSRRCPPRLSSRAVAAAIERPGHLHQVGQLARARGPCDAEPRRAAAAERGRAAHHPGAAGHGPLQQFPSLDRVVGAAPRRCRGDGGSGSQRTPIAPGSGPPGVAGRAEGAGRGRAPLFPKARPRRPGPRRPCPRAASSRPAGWRRGRRCTPPRRPPTGPAGRWPRRGRSARRRRGSGRPGRPAASRAPGRDPGPAPTAASVGKRPSKSSTPRHVEPHVVDAVLAHAGGDGGGDHVAGLQLVDEPPAPVVAQQGALAPQRLAEQRSRSGGGPVQGGRVELHELDVRDRHAGPQRHGQAVPGRLGRVGGDRVQLAGAPGGQQGVGRPQLDRRSRPGRGRSRPGSGRLRR